jgi:hypothetical protein
MHRHQRRLAEGCGGARSARVHMTLPRADTGVARSASARYVSPCQALRERGTMWAGLTVIARSSVQGPSLVIQHDQATLSAMNDWSRARDPSGACVSKAHEPAVELVPSRLTLPHNPGGVLSRAGLGATMCAALRTCLVWLHARLNVSRQHPRSMAAPCCRTRMRRAA